MQRRFSNHNAHKRYRQLVATENNTHHPITVFDAKKKTQNTNQRKSTE